MVFDRDTVRFRDRVRHFSGWRVTDRYGDALSCTIVCVAINGTARSAI